MDSTIIYFGAVLCPDEVNWSGGKLFSQATQTFRAWDRAS